MMQAHHASQLLHTVPACRLGMRVQPLEFTRHGAISSRSRSVRDMRVRAEGKFRQRVDGAVRAGDKAATSAADLLPASIPRGAAKLGVLGIGGLVAFWLLQKVLSTVFFLAMVGGAAYLWLKLSGKDDSGGDGGNDALADAKRIMDKYR